MIRKISLTIWAFWLLGGVGLLSGMSVVTENRLDEQVHFLEYALKNHAHKEIKAAVDSFDPQTFSFSDDDPMLARFSRRLVDVGLELLNQGQKETAFQLFQKIRLLDPSEWRGLSYREQFRDDKKFVDFANTKKMLDQLNRLFKQFEPSVILLTQVNEALLWAVMLTLLAFAVWLIRNYLPLATHDMILNEKGILEKKRLLAWFLLLLWPIFIGSGWFLLAMVLIASLWFYADKAEKKTLLSLLVLLALMTVLQAVNLFLLDQAKNPSFLQTKDIIKNHLLDYNADAIEGNPNAKLMMAFNNFHSGYLEEGMEWLNAVDEKVRHNIKRNLYGYAFLVNKDYQNAISAFAEVLSQDGSDSTALYNLTLALMENKDEKSYEAFLNRFPKISQFREKVGQARLPTVSQGFIWSLFVSSGKKPTESTPIFVFRAALKNLIRIPTLFFFIVFLAYIKLLPHLFHDIGKSTHCAKCQKAIKKGNSNRAVNVCNDCYQLFLIKDSMMADAKSFKEAEINRINRRKNSLLLLFSFLSPGFFLHMRGQHRLFSIFSFFYFLFVFLAFVAWHPLAEFYGTVPLFAKAFGVLAAFLFLVSNALIFQGDEYGI